MIAPTMKDSRDRWQAAGIFLVYLLVTLVCFAHSLPGHFGDYYIGRETDPTQTMWFFNWWRFSLSHGLNPFLTDWVWAPLGINLAWTTFVPLPSLISIPLQVTIGEPATYNIVAMLMPLLAAYGAFLLCRRVTGALWPSFFGGYLFGFSPYMLGQMLGHMVCIVFFPVPLIALITLKRLDDEISATWFALILAALLIVQSLCAIELFATVTLVGGFSLLLALLVFDGDVRTRLLDLVTPIIGGYLISITILSPYLYYMLAFGRPSGPIWPPSFFSADLIGFLVPRQTVWWGSADFATAISRHFVGDIMENGDYLGVVLIVFVEIFRRRFWPAPAGKFLTILFFAIIVAALGPNLHVAGVQGIPMPWAVFQRLPLIEHVLPVRLMMYASLVVAVMVAMWFASRSTSLLKQFAAAAIIFVSVAPNPRASFWVSSLDLPAFFTGRTYATELQPREIILPLPWAQTGNSMYWQLKSDMYFRMAGGWTGISPFEFDRMPIVNYFFGQTDLPEAGDQLKAYLARFAVTAIVADPSYAGFRTFQPALESIGVAAQLSGGVLLYKIPPAEFAPYAKLSGADLEARAAALRFDTILAAAANYVAGGNELQNLSALELQRFKLLPPGWQVANGPYSLHDWSIGVLQDKRIAIVLLGSPDGVKPLLDRYFGKVDELDYPAPSRWDPHSSPPKDQMGKMLMILDRAQLEAAAAQLKSSPPPEMITPFLRADSR
jgi:hypothetical protein